MKSITLECFLACLCVHVHACVCMRVGGGMHFGVRMCACVCFGVRGFPRCVLVNFMLSPVKHKAHREPIAV